MLDREITSEEDFKEVKEEAKKIIAERIDDLDYQWEDNLGDTTYTERFKTVREVREAIVEEVGEGLF